jgi:hypothetical protein
LYEGTASLQSWAATVLAKEEEVEKQQEVVDEEHKKSRKICDKKM